MRFLPFSAPTSDNPSQEYMRLHADTRRFIEFGPVKFFKVPALTGSPDNELVVYLYFE